MKATIFSKQINFAPAFNCEDFTAYIKKIQELYLQRFSPAMLAAIDGSIDKVLFAGLKWKREGSGNNLVEKFQDQAGNDLIIYFHATDSIQVCSRHELGAAIYYEPYAVLKHCSAFTLEHVLCFFDSAGVQLYWNIQTRTKYLTL